MIHHLKNFRRSNKFLNHITFQKKFHSIPTTSNNVNIIYFVLQLKQKLEYIIIQISLTNFDLYKKSNSLQSFRYENLSRFSHQAF